MYDEHSFDVDYEVVRVSA